jgi:hypothetical protein
VPLPSHEGCGPVYKTSTHLGSEIAPLPFPKGCGRFIVVRRKFHGRFWEGKAPGGTHEVGGSCGVSGKRTTSSFSPIILPTPTLLTSLGCEDDPRG